MKDWRPSQMYFMPFSRTNFIGKIVCNSPAVNFGTYWQQNWKHAALFSFFLTPRKICLLLLSFKYNSAIRSDWGGILLPRQLRAKSLFVGSIMAKINWNQLANPPILKWCGSESTYGWIRCAHTFGDYHPLASKHLATDFRLQIITTLTDALTVSLYAGPGEL